MLISVVLFLATTGIATASDGENMLETFVKLQRALRERRSVLGEASYDCYSDGACALEYRQEGLLTYREELLCARSEQGCGDSVAEVRKREAECSFLAEQLCRRGTSSPCEFAQEEEDCSEVLERKRRGECEGLVRRSAAECGSWGRRAVRSEECAAVMQEMEEMQCGGGGTILEKRDNDCDAGWQKHDKNCYKYFAGPVSYHEARKECTNQNGRLATPEKLISGTPADREFFDNLIESSGAKAKIDSVLGDMDDHFGGQNWDEVITYYDNWAWINVKMNAEGDAWLWDEGNEVKIGLSDWEKKQPSFGNDVGMDGKCVVYFHKTRSESHADEDTVDEGAWWNTNCNLNLPFFCEMAVDSF